jgi:hypothetical protein
VDHVIMLKLAVPDKQWRCEFPAPGGTFNADTLPGLADGLILAGPRENESVNKWGMPLP